MSKTDLAQQPIVEYIEQNIPLRKTEEYKYTLLGKELKKITPSYGEKISNFQSGILPKNEIIELSFYNGELITDISTIDEKGLKIDRLNSSSISEDGLNDPFDVLNKKYANAGVIINISKGIEKTILFNIISGNKENTPYSLIQNSIEIENNVEANIVTTNYYEGDLPSFNSHLFSVKIGKNARLKSYNLQLNGKNNIEYNSIKVSQERDSYYKNVTICLEGKLLRNNHAIAQEDVNCETHLFGFYLPGNNNHFDNHTVVDHKIEQGYSNELYKGIMGENGTAVFNGKIFVRPNAQNTNAFQSNKNILLSDTANLHTKPQLEIWADDVKCSHGCTTGKLDNEALFYLRSRGIGKKEAESLLLKAFAADISNEIEFESLRNLVVEEIDIKISKETA